MMTNVVDRDRRVEQTMVNVVGREREVSKKKVKQAFEEGQKLRNFENLPEKCQKN